MDGVGSPMKNERRRVRRVPFDNTLNGRARSRPSDVTSPAFYVSVDSGSTDVAFLLIGPVSFDFGLTTVSSCVLIEKKNLFRGRS